MNIGRLRNDDGNNEFSRREFHHDLFDLTLASPDTIGAKAYLQIRNFEKSMYVLSISG